MEMAVFIPDLDRLPAADQPYDRLYLGSEFCAWRLPGERELHKALDAVAGRRIGFSLVTPFLDEPGLERVLGLARALPDDPSVEIVANDLGLVESLRAAGWRGTIVAGRLLTRQRRGPGFQSFGTPPPEAVAALRGSALDSPAFVELLGSEYGVRRFELDDLVQGVSVPAVPAGVRLSLYRPYLLVTATRNCPWIFDGRAWDRSRGCARPCCGQALRLVPVPERGPDIQESARIKHGEGEGVARRGGLHGADRRERNGGPQRQDPAAQDGSSLSPEDTDRTLLLGGCAQFLEHRSDAPAPAGVDRIVWQPEIPA